MKPVDGYDDMTNVNPDTFKPIYWDNPEYNIPDECLLSKAATEEDEKHGKEVKEER